MKKLMPLIFIVAILMMQGCCEYISSTGKTVQGEHELMSITSSATDVVFCWKHDSTKQIINSALPRQKVRIIYDGTGKSKPTIKFRWKQVSETDIVTIMKEDIVYMEIHCSSAQYPYDPSKQINIVYNEDGSIQDSTSGTDRPTEIVSVSSSTAASMWDGWNVSQRYDFLMYTVYLNGDESSEYSKQIFSDLGEDIQAKIQSNL